MNYETMIINQKLDQSDIVYCVYRSSCLYRCSASWAPRPAAVCFYCAAWNADAV